jgi:hypothetical protein
VDTTAKRRAILARLKAGEISEDQADTELERLLNPPKPGRGRPRKTTIYLRDENGERVALRKRYRRKPSRRELEIGRHYVEQVEAGGKPMNAMRHTLKKFSTKREPLEDSSVRRYAGLYKQHRKDWIERHRQLLEFHSSLLGAQYQARIESANDIARREIERLEAEARERFNQARESALSLVGRGFGVGHKK